MATLIPHGLHKDDVVEINGCHFIANPASEIAFHATPCSEMDSLANLDLDDQNRCVVKLKERKNDAGDFVYVSTPICMLTKDVKNSF